MNYEMPEPVFISWLNVMFFLCGTAVLVVGGVVYVLFSHLAQQPVLWRFFVLLAVVAYGGMFFIIREAARMSRYHVRGHSKLVVKFLSNQGMCEGVVTAHDVRQIYTRRRPLYPNFGLVDLVIATKMGDVPVNGITEAKAKQIKKLLGRH